MTEVARIQSINYYESAEDFVQGFEESRMFGDNPVVGTYADVPEDAEVIMAMYDVALDLAPGEVAQKTAARLHARRNMPFEPDIFEVTHLSKGQVMVLIKR